MILTLSILITLLLLAAMVALLIARMRGKPIPLAVLPVIGLMALMVGSASFFVHRASGEQDYRELLWQPLAADRIPMLVENGYTVFVDLHSDWCMPCQANRAGVLHRPEVVNILRSDKVVLMQANWIQDKDLILPYYGRVAAPEAPFNKVYGPALPKGIILPTELTEDAVIVAIHKAKGH
ncbi:thioredoxin family protein [Shewanella sedimentimangrovi]|uniref:Thioredoxin family protein n=1 Tax=Shewanella sedimentimangrovi TaxID=2814293 RepID=A0ABX7R233_9GAMM|nr:thioredoxin family protein [Shewanella sedimentimangrovi]QSX37889.1 thioredoxin family protein [Shewanella sedimentimangrovi]